MACASPGSHAPDRSGDDAGGDDGSVGSSGAPGSSGASSGQGMYGMFGSGSGGQADAGDAGRLTRCDDAGHCSCINIASIGHEGVWGPNCIMGDTTAFITWLNSQSTAKVDVYDQAKPTITADFLARYDVLILQWMVTVGMQNNDGAAWTFTPDELSAFQTWVNNGGGLIVLSGYQCPANGCTIYDTIAPNQVLKAVTNGDLLFNSDDVLDPAVLQPQPDGYCWGNSLPLGDPLPEGGAPTVGTWNQSTPIGTHVHDVGAYVARSIKVGSPNVVVDVNDSTHTFVAHEQVGMGHIVAYGDEWVTYTGEWYSVSPDGGANACQDVAMNCGTSQGQYNACCTRLPQQVFQIPQFWYNSIKYAASSVQCFTIMPPPGSQIIF
jgi:hypothetical protein